MFRSRSGNKVCMIPEKYEFLHSNICGNEGYVTGILESLTNKVFSPTLASLMQLGAYDFTILNEDR